MRTLTEEIHDVIPECCEIAFADISKYSQEQQKFIYEIFPETNTIIVLGHHIKNSLEWAWFPLISERTNSTCPADLHIKNVIEKISNVIKNNNYRCFHLPYPGRCGLLFKEFAEKSGMGQMGDSYLFLHPKWGPWIHLRLLLTNAKIEENVLNLTNQDICIHCEKCISACPGNAIKKDDFNGILCDSTQERLKADMQIPEGYLWKCETCVRVCPIGKQPELMIIK